METCALPEVALEDAEKTRVQLLPAVNDRGDGETVTPEGSPVAVTVIAAEKPFSGTACTCTL
jgi:hypothetical protein